MKNAALLISNHIVFHPLAKNKPIHQDDPQSLKNLDSEAQLR